MARSKGKPLSSATDDADRLYHGGVVRTAGPFPSVDETTAARFMASIDKGLKALENGSSPYARDVERVPRAAVETFDMFDIDTGEHLMIWRVACRDRKKHAN